MSHPLEPGHDTLREGALESAIILRDCSVKLPAPDLKRHDCRALMREQALRWRRASIIYR